MQTIHRSDKREFLTLLGISFVLLLGGILLTHAYLMDDALITLRYSFNLARHGHAIWNQADAAHPDLGYTTFSWMLLNALPALFTTNKDALVLACKLLGLLPLVGIVLLLVAPISRMPVPLLFRIAVVGAIFSQAVYGFHLNSGMETLLFSALILLTVCTYARESRSAWAYAYGTLAFLTRPEGALIVALLLFWDLRRGRLRPAAAGGVGFALAVLALGGILFAYYGAVLPNAFYVKQRYLSLGGVLHTVKFLASLALPYLPLAAYSTYRLKHPASRYCWAAAAVYTAYYLSVVPVMSVFSRYQWPVLVLLTYASLPAFQKLGERISEPGLTRPRQLAVAVFLLAALVNLRSSLAAAHMARSAGVAEQNLIALGKAMAKHRDGSRWMAYCDAGAVCYYSDWNSYDTMGLNTRQIADGSVKPLQVYGYRNTDLVMLNRGDAWPTGPCWPSARDCDELAERLGKLGYHPASGVPIFTEGGKQRWVIALFARSVPRARTLLREVQVASEAPESPLEQARAVVERMAKGRAGPQKLSPRSAARPLSRT
jgi:hypothetical protein